MKIMNVLLSIFFLLSPNLALAQTQNLNSDPIEIPPEQLLEGGIITNVVHMKERMCTALHQGRNTDSVNIAERLRGIVLFSFDLNADDERLEEQIAVIFNRYSSRMVCPATSGIYPKQHLFKRAVELHVYQDALVEFFFANPITFPIDPNVIELSPLGSETTLMDYINRELAADNAKDKHNVGRLIRLRRLLQIRFNAKTVAEMTPNEIEFQLSRHKY
ncbi:hypothetical protein GCM10009069_29550 [Algimonas arctica]|uniref:Uncharacterized protein n=1 Tax=Algimonas arctica TaxID=1479486 RepID=A0A8J3CTH5_9PROT|nr:hypothetical protein [Algimonas arctica]GHB05123.1 hypothetical protein GCM10009069_29550 [Algimonas arctica]